MNVEKIKKAIEVLSTPPCDEFKHSKDEYREAKAVLIGAAQADISLEEEKEKVEKHGANE